MNRINPQSPLEPRVDPGADLNVLATDLDGTLIPLEGNERNREDLDKLRKARENLSFRFIYVTGRHFESVQRAVDEHGLPPPDWIVCDVGTSIYHKVKDDFTLFGPYRSHLQELTRNFNRGKIEDLLSDLDGLEMQQEDHQQEFKISYECTAEQTEELGERISRILEESDIPYHATTSIDPFLNCGLIDLLPSGASKAYALTWLSTHAGFHPDSVVFAGDSGNDLAALISGFHAIVVANAAEGLAEMVRADLCEKKLESHLYCSAGKATSGVLEGCVHFGLIPREYA